MSKRDEKEVVMIPLDQIIVINPRERGKSKFRQITNNIASLGLKKPITVTRKPSSDDTVKEKYWLVCGQGRYEAYKALGQIEIPAIIVDVTKEKLLLMSLVENLARRQHSSVEQVHEIESLKDRGYSFAEIAKKTDLDVGYVRGIVKLIKHGEERLVMAVERGQIPLSVAVTIATSDDHDIQRALTEAYESNDLRGKKLLAARRLIEKRQVDGKTLRTGPRRAKPEGVSSKKLLETYQSESARQRLVVQKSKLCETRLLFVVSAIRQLVEDKKFLELMRSESLDSMPAYLASEISQRGEIL
ncbi:MAG: plasmid partitioning protein RepB C-terminal domain-containing protein [Pirellulaceae bacterium]|nr:plasmid partitioning protein RepB C-terminal domain-containing protein [Pirellulaceae bacterium]